MSLKQLFGLMHSSLTEEDLYHALKQASEHDHRVNYFNVPGLLPRRDASLQRKRVRVS